AAVVRREGGRTLMSGVGAWWVGAIGRTPARQRGDQGARGERRSRAAEIHGSRTTPVEAGSTPAAKLTSPAPAGARHDCGFGTLQRRRHGSGLVVPIVHHIGSHPGASCRAAGEFGNVGGE